MSQQDLHARFAEQGHRRREPGRWTLSLLVAVGAGVVAMLVAWAMLAAVLAPTGSTIFAGPIAIVAGLAASVLAAVLTWRAIRRRWHRMPPGPETRWGR